MTIIIKYPRQTKEGNKVFFEKKDKFCWVPFKDIEQLKDARRLEK